ncbi:LPXTG-site transpeptidase (sortase) family protein [Microbacterium proteolyticum]|uniref:LPXTG-site transpeptidase (Sortase) family protein n=1 Tax=Microbacterium proteolyticum TaxID=1572644 RepID=A0A7W5GFJ2_9MICO|nr:LPXTG-site transpeptidase (sortase) family protein [Microbacterium proteolyticum]
MIDARRGAHRQTPLGWPARTACALALVAVLSCAGCSAVPQAASPAPVPSAPTSVPTPSATVAPPVVVAPSSPAPVAPARVVIPTLALDEPLIELGIADDGGMEVPVDYDEVGWFSGGGRPGGNGPTVIAAHVDSPTGPAVFQALKNLAVGDVVEVYGEDGVAHLYRVTETADYPKSAFPTARVFGATARDELRLITCGGVFDRDAGSYVDNRVVYAEPA